MHKRVVNMKQVILGVDPGTKVTGVGIIEASTQKMHPLYFANIYAKAKKLEYCYLTIYQELEQLVARYTPDAISVETQFVYKNVQSSMKLSMARAIVMLVAAKHDIPLYEYAPKKAKLAVTGNGSSSKHQVQKMVAMILNIKEKLPPEDAADALSLAICHSHYCKRIAYV